MAGDFLGVLRGGDAFLSSKGLRFLFRTHFPCSHDKCTQTDTKLWSGQRLNCHVNVWTPWRQWHIWPQRGEKGARCSDRKREQPAVQTLQAQQFSHSHTGCALKSPHFPSYRCMLPRCIPFYSTSRASLQSESCRGRGPVSLALEFDARVTKLLEHGRQLASCNVDYSFLCTSSNTQVLPPG